MFKKLIFSLFIISSNLSYAQFGGPTPVKVANVQEVMMAPTRKIPVTVESKFLTQIKAESRGIVSSIAELGSQVSLGGVLAELTDSQAVLKQQELKDEVNSNQARFNFLKAENTRLKDLIKKNLVSNSELEQNQSDYISAQSDLAGSKSRLKQYKDQVTKLTILAPFDGFVMQQIAQPGQFLNNGDDVLVFMGANDLEVVVNVPFKYKSQIQNKALWKIETEDKRMIDASVSRFIPAATGKSHTIKVHLNVSDSQLWPGEAVNVLIPTQTPQKVIAIPRDALVIRRNGSYVFTVVDNKSHKVDVITGMAQGDLIEAIGLLGPNDQVIIRGNERLQDQQEVNILE
jgi:RND family efflux transporter MFP subunit